MELLFLTKVWSSRRSVVVFGEVFRTENLALSIRFAAGIRLPRLLEATSILLFEQKDHRVFWALLACIAVCKITYAPTQKALRNMSRSAKVQSLANPLIFIALSIRKGCLRFPKGDSSGL